MRLRKSSIGLVALVVVFGLLGLYNYVLQPMLLKKFILGAEPPPVAVSAETARLETRSDSLTAVGSIQAVNGVDVAAEQDGVVREILFESGQMVKKGQVLVRLDTETEAADVALYQATLANAQKDYERTAKLVETQYASRAALDRAVAARDQAQAQLARARASLDKKAIRAPFSGRLGIRQINLGQYLARGDAVVTLQAVDPIYATFPVPEQAISRIQTGQNLLVSVDSAPGRRFEGKITSIDAKVDEGTRNVTVQATLPNPDGLLTPGAFANVTVLGRESVQVVAIPATAVSYSLYGDSIYVLKPAPKAATAQGGANASTDAEAGKAHEQNQTVYVAERRSVKTGETQDGRAAILDGLKDGELVVIAGQLKLSDGGKAVVNNSIPLDAGNAPLPRH
ncbi:MAG TPA: efflux RND transporter periplasmic adaptor subunit [Pedomonas sp.]|uniref:efflux RND transporter periplasmic adaptor subunit n=1 Tax=Pedomonas sp. TaxID=2976421 RepID=UPI002F405A4F